MDTSPVSEDNNWDALKKCLGAECVGEFTFIGSVPFDGKIIFQYRHVNTRQTIHIDQDGKTYESVNRLESPEADHFERTTKAEAKERVLGKTPRSRE